VLKRKTLSLVLAFSMILCLLPTMTANAAFENTYVLTGNQRKDILGVAVTQLGYVEGPHYGMQYGNDTKYGDWYGLPYNAWCAMFISWCARQADISTKILRNSCRAGPQADPERFNIPYYHGTEYTPQPGDLFFLQDFSHVGLVYEVHGETVVTLEANVNYEGVSEEEGYTVAILERKINELWFGVPAYEGCDTCPATGGDHAYVRNFEEAHPHANYFECSACGDLYYTGSHTQDTDCHTCMGCGCSTDYAGLYKVVGVSKRLNLREGHGTNYWQRSVAELDSVVEVLAGNGYWAHVLDGVEVYYASMSYLQRYVPAPGNLKTDLETYISGETATVSWDRAKSATSYRIRVSRDDQQILDSELGDTLSCDLEALEPGDYEISVTASHGSTVSEVTKCGFRVLRKYDVVFDGQEGTNVPQPQQKIQDRPLTLSDGIPEKEGFTFLGWDTDAAAKTGLYQPGDVWTEDGDTTLYAVWKSGSAVPESLEILTPAQTNLYLVGDPLDTRGLSLLIRYSDGTAKRVTAGYEVSGFQSETAAELTLTVSVEGVSAAYSVSVLDYYPGDIDRNRQVDREDVMQLLWHISFPELFPLEVPADFTGDDVVDRADVMQLLWHISFPEMFPLK